MSAQIVPFESPVLTSSSVCFGSCAKKYSSASPRRTERMLSLSARSAELRGGAPVGVSGIDAASMGRPRFGRLKSHGDPAGVFFPPPADSSVRSGSGGALRLEDLV